jgi:hypothetical protein
MSTSKPSVAFLGATGGVTNSILIRTLLAGHHCIALVRNGQKLRDMLTKQEVPANVQQNLTIVEGNGLQAGDIKKMLLSTPTPNTLPTAIVTGLGGNPVMKFSIWKPLSFISLDQPGLCGTSAAAVLTALHEIYTEQPQLKTQKPLLTFISTTGITRGPEDVPFWMRFLYHQILHEPHLDKREMENVFRGDQEQSSEEQRVLRTIVGIRPTLLTPYDNSPADYRDVIDGGLIRAGTEKKPELGYSVKRGNVGLWVWENVVKEVVEGRRGRWEGEMVSLTA